MELPDPRCYPDPDDLDEERRRLERAQADPAEFRWFVDRHAGWILALLRGLTQDRDLADELAARVFFRALRGLAGYRWAGRPYGAYLRRIAINEWTSAGRERRRTRQVTDWSEAGGLADPRPGALEEMVNDEEARALRAAIAGLGPADREVLAMYYWEGLTTPEIAARLETPEGTVTSRLKRARDTLAARYAPPAPAESAPPNGEPLPD